MAAAHEIVTLPACRYLGKKGTFSAETMGTAFRAAGDAAAFLKAKDAAYEGNMTGVYHDVSGKSSDGSFSCDLNAGFKLPDGMELSAEDVPEGLTLESFEARTAVKYVHKGGYEDLGAAWAEATRLAKAQGYLPVFPGFEEYVAMPGAPGGPETHIYQTVVKPGEEGGKPIATDESC